MPSSRTGAQTGGFRELGLSEALASVLATLGYEEPTPVQRETIPLLLQRVDLIAMAATGTGKTAAFALPLIQRLTDPSDEAAAADAEGDGDEAADAGARAATKQRAAGIQEVVPRLVGKKPAPKPSSRTAHHTAGLVLVPTRELAMQVCESIHKYSKGTGLTVVPLYGGASMGQQIRSLERGADVVVATPGRALDHVRRQTLQLAGVRMLVLDEADEMLDMGFADDIEALLAETPPTRQTALFSATVPPRIQKIADRHLQKPRKVAVAREKTAAGKMPRVRQVAYLVRRNEKPAALDRILDMEQPASAIVFCRTRLDVDTLVETLNAHGYRAEALHGGMQQRQRDAVMNRVRAATTDLLIATDVAARGLDIEHISHVVNYDLPTDAESYIHRIGRTGRAGRTGTAITLAEPREHRLLRSIEAATRQKIEVANVPTVADLKTRRLEMTVAALRERLTAADSDDVRVVVETLADEFDLFEIAAAAVKMFHLASVGDSDDADIAPVAAPAEPASPRDTAKRGRPASKEPNMTRLFVGAGRNAGVRPGDLVGAIAGETGLPSSAIGAIRVSESFSVVEVPESQADEVIAGMRGVLIRGQKVVVRRDRDAAPPRNPSRG